MRPRTVVVKFEVQTVVDVPEDWPTEFVEFSFNGKGSWYANNIVRILDEEAKRLDKAGTCLCPHVSATFIREATENDEAVHRMFVNKLPS